MSQTLEIGVVQLVFAGALLLITGLVSVLLRLGLEKTLLVAACRTVVQLLLIGFVLEWIFLSAHPAWLLLVVAVMLGVASDTAVRRPRRSFSGARRLSFLSLALTGLIVTYLVTAVIVRAEPWYTPQYLIPLLGMILGNSLTAIALTLDSLLTTLAENRDRVEMELAHGATAWEAAREPLADAVRKGLIPVLNSMAVVGLVALPGMMTGQILAGADPLLAVRYQIVVMFMICAANALASVLVAVAAFKRLFDEQHRLRRERIRESGTER